MTIPSAVDEALARCVAGRIIPLKPESVNELAQDAWNLAAEVRRLRQPVSDAEVSALEGRLKNPVPVKYVDEILSVANDAIALLRRRTAGAGWKLVPMEPTEEMNMMGQYWVDRAAAGIDDDECADRVYRAMIAAAPPAAGDSA